MCLLYLYDWDVIEVSVWKMGCVVFMNEDMEITNFGEYLVRCTCDELFGELCVALWLHVGVYLFGVGFFELFEIVFILILDLVI